MCPVRPTRVVRRRLRGIHVRAEEGVDCSRMRRSRSRTGQTGESVEFGAQCVDDGLLGDVCVVVGFEVFRLTTPGDPAPRHPSVLRLRT